MAKAAHGAPTWSRHLGAAGEASAQAASSLSAPSDCAWPATQGARKQRASEHHQVKRLAGNLRPPIEQEPPRENGTAEPQRKGSGRASHHRPRKVVWPIVQVTKCKPHDATLTWY